MEYRANSPSSVTKGDDGSEGDGAAAYIPGQNVCIGDDSCINVEDVLKSPQFAAPPSINPGMASAYSALDSDSGDACTCSVGQMQSELYHNPSQPNSVHRRMCPISHLCQDMTNLNVSSRKQKTQTAVNLPSGMNSVDTIPSSSLTGPVTLYQTNNITINKPINVTDSSNINIGEHSTMIHEAPPAHTLNQPTYENTVPQTCATDRTLMRGDMSHNVWGAAVKECISELQDHYSCIISKLQPIPWCDWHEIRLTDVYTKLELEERRGVFRPIRLEKIFDTLPDTHTLPKRIIIRGNPGIGKSTLCRKLAYDWATGAYYMVNHFDVVLLIEVRQMTGTIKDAISDQLLPHDMKDDVRNDFFHFIENHQERVAIILDGIDELNSNIRTDIKKFIDRKIYKRVTVLVTSRPDKDMHIPQLCYDRFIVNNGYTLDNGIDFIHRYFKHNVQESCCSELVDGIRTSLYLQDLASNPLNIILLCIIWQENKTMPQTKHELFNLLEYCVTRRFCMKMGIEMPGNDIPDECQTLLHEISEIAFEGIMDETYRFKESNLRKRYKDSLFYKMGFMTEELSTAIIKTTTFLVFPHKTIQERFAARYLMHLPGKKRQRHIETLAYSNSYNVLVHASGYMNNQDADIAHLINSVHMVYETYLSLEDRDINVSKIKQNVDEYICLALECIYESKCNSQLIKKLTSFIKRDICVPLPTCKTSTLYTLASILQHKSCRFKSLHVIIGEDDQNKWEILLGGIAKNSP
ncbi:uncharacterized protein LOC100377607 [Saccoglossus kowalevskii]|uniref:Uncharacterized protein LOC100377607 n=1 Tax=Saccoglossus kowalevskii TaxID=10224 RepID=A0ABM0GJP9_SACKO|nr:PREDICTED: uncharacterized protein LOC100377607 [Saccoglossus kowalevskii]